MNKFLTSILLASLIAFGLTIFLWWLSFHHPQLWPDALALPPFNEEWMMCVPNSILDIGYWNQCVRTADHYGFLQSLLFLQKTLLVSAIFFGVSLIVLTSSPSSSDAIIRGRILHKGQSTIKALKRDLKKNKGPKGIPLTKGIHLPQTFETRHWLISGAVGSGKTVFIRNLLSKFVDNGHRCLVLDTKADFVGDLSWPAQDGNRYAACLLNPFDKRSAEWWLGYDIVDVETAREFARKFLSENHSDPFWSKATANVMVAVICSLYSEKGTDWSWIALAQRITASPDQLLAWAKAYYPPAVTVLESQGNEAAKSILINFATDFAAIGDIARYWHADNKANKVSLRSWLTDEGNNRILLIGWDSSRETASKGWAGAFIDLAGMFIASPEYRGNGRTNLVLDEFAQLPKMKGVVSSLDVGRSKGVSVLIGVQSINQLVSIYKERAESFRSLIGNHVFTQMAAGKDAKEASEFLGNQTIRKRNVSVSDSRNSRSVSESWVEEQRPLMTPDEFSSWLGPDSRGVQLIYTGLGLDAYLLHVPYPAIRPFRQSFVPAEPKELPRFTREVSDENKPSKPNPFKGLTKKG